MFAMDYRLAQGKVNQLRAEAEKDRRSRMARATEHIGFERLVQSVGQGLLRIGEKPRRQRLHRHAI
jgi:hypothetical protein